MSRHSRLLRLKLLLAFFLAGTILGCQGEVAEELSGDQQAATSAVASPEEPSYLLLALGDSLTEGIGVEEESTYPALLEARLQEAGLPWRVQNAGVAGETSSGALSRLEWVLQIQPDAVILETGGNDGLRGVDPEVTEDNLRRMIVLLKERGVPVMLAGMRAPANLGEAYTRRFEASFSRVAEQENVPLIDFFLEGVAGVPELNQPDRIHPTAEGYRAVVDHIGPQVEGWLRELAEESKL